MVAVVAVVVVMVVMLLVMLLVLVEVQVVVVVVVVVVVEVLLLLLVVVVVVLLQCSRCLATCSRVIIRQPFHAFELPGFVLGRLGPRRRIIVFSRKINFESKSHTLNPVQWQPQNTKSKVPSPFPLVPCWTFDPD